MKPPKELKMTKEMWKTILLWSGYYQYLSLEEIADRLGVSENTVKARIKRFHQKYPQPYEKIKGDRDAIKAATLRQLHRAINPWSFEDELDTDIQEKW